MGRRSVLGAGLVSAVAVVVALLTGVTGGASTAAQIDLAQVSAAKSRLADWTMMVYAVGDTSNVSELMVENLAMLAKLPDDPKVNIVVLLDLPERTDPGAPDSVLPGLGQFTTAKLLTLDGGRYREIRDLGEVSMGRPDTLASFIAEAADRFPAKKYGLTMFDHGGGNTGAYLDTGPPSTAILTIPQMRAGIQAGMQAAGIDKFDVIYHAACLEASYETASALAPLTRSMAGSEEIMIGYPLAVGGFLPLSENGSGDDVGNAFIQGYGAFLDEVAAEDSDQTYRDLAAMSVVDGAGITKLDAAIESFSKVASADMDQIATQVAKARGDALEFIIGLPDEQDQSADLVDLGDFLRHLTDVPDEVAVARDAAYAALQEAVKHQLTGRATQQATGLNVYLPTSPRNAGDYLTDGTAPLGWGTFVKAFLDAGQAQAAADPVAFADSAADVKQQDDTGILVQGQLASGDGARVTDSFTQVYTTLGDREGALAMILPAYVGAGGDDAVQGVWDYSLLTLDDGKRSVPVTAEFQAQSGGLVGNFEAQYTAPDGTTSDVGFRVLLSSEGEIQGVSTVDISDGAAGGTDLANGGSLTPYVYVSSSSGNSRELSSQSIPVTDDLSVNFTRQATGTPFDLVVIVSDIGGNTDGAGVSSTVQ